jgi:drug/metabolite transporter (DMT)-like permease
MKTVIVLILAMLAQASGDTILSRGMREAEAFSRMTGGDWFSMAGHAASNPSIWLGTALLVAFIALFSAVLSWADLSFVLPASSFGYVLNVAFAWHFLGERVSLAKWAGTIFICAGVLAVSRSGIKSTDVQEDKVAALPPCEVSTSERSSTDV